MVWLGRPAVALGLPAALSSVASVLMAAAMVVSGTNGAVSLSTRLRTSLLVRSEDVEQGTRLQRHHGLGADPAFSLFGHPFPVLAHCEFLRGRDAWAQTAARSASTASPK